MSGFLLQANCGLAMMTRHNRLSKDRTKARLGLYLRIAFRYHSVFQAFNVLHSLLSQPAILEDAKKTSKTNLYSTASCKSLRTSVL